MVKVPRFTNGGSGDDQRGLPDTGSCSLRNSLTEVTAYLYFALYRFVIVVVIATATEGLRPLNLNQLLVEVAVTAQTVNDKTRDAVLVN